MIRILVADDHPIFRQGLKQVLEESAEIEVAGEAGSGREALEKIRNGIFDVVTLDISMPDIGGLDVLKQVHAEQPDLCVLMLSIYPEEQYAIRALKAGAKGYLTKTSVPEELVTAIQEIAGGNRYITRSLSKKLAAELLDPHVGELPHERLTDREFQVMSGLARGETVSDIAGKLGLSVKTISTHRAHLLAKMELDSNAQVMRYALKNGLVE